MQVILIGSGNIASVMGKSFLEKGHIIVQVYSRNEVNANALAAILGAQPVTDMTLISKDADLYLLAVTDDALPDVAAMLSVKDKLVIHTAGSVSKEVLKDCSSAYGVMWPMKMIRSAQTALGPVNIVIDGNSEQVIAQIKKIAAEFSSDINIANDETRAKMHMIAALTTNFSNHLYHLAADYCKSEKIDFSFFYPLIESAVHQIREKDPGELQAGPAYRNDQLTILKHEKLLTGYPQILKIYDIMTESIKKTNSKPQTPNSKP